ncbi:hypothetical protein QTP88_000743 [Uroleucon formosanum]
MYPQLWKEVELLIMAFPSTCLVEKGFSAVQQLLTKLRNKLEICERGDLRLMLTSIEPDIISLAGNHQPQGITRCSIFEDAQAVEGEYFSDIVELGNARCWEMHQKRSYTFPLEGVATDLQMNETTLISHTVAGSLDRFGNCKGTNYKSNRGEWENVIVQAKFKIYLSEGTAIANSEDNTLILPSGTKMKLSDNYGVDTFKGETVWTKNHYNCEEQ